MNKILIDSKKESDTGQALTLLCLIVFMVTFSRLFVTFALILLVVNMVCPVVFRPAAFVWFGLAEVLGMIVSRIVLTLVFVVMVIPVGLIRYWAGSDPMRLKEWKQSPNVVGCQNDECEGKGKYKDSVFVERNHLYTAQDIINPY
ncbi:MAG: hypothetical protein LBQ66_08990 [Planctomycetaceae bacterium]|jgi:hypothetical protein|nr:hypothetical protein [Planctomycetaceae bacterium]